MAVCQPLFLLFFAKNFKGAARKRAFIIEYVSVIGFVRVKTILKGGLRVLVIFKPRGGLKS